MGLSRGVKGCIGKYLAVELLMKTARPDAMDVGFFGVAVWWRYLLNSSYTLQSRAFKSPRKKMSSPACIFGLIRSDTS